MENENIAPVNHGVLSSVGTTAAEAGRGGLSGMLTGALKGPLVIAGIFSGIASLSGISSAIALVSAAEGGAVLAAVGTAASGLLTSALIWGGVGLALGVVVAPFLLAPLGAAIGLTKGVVNGTRRVSDEKGAANMLQAQVDVARAQAASQSATTNIYAPSASNDNKYSFPPQGSAMNAAMPQIQADSAQGMGTMAGRNLQIA